MKKKQQFSNNIDEDFRAIGINALLKRRTDHALDIHRMTSFDSDTRLDLQICYAKLDNLLKGPANREIVSEGNTSYLEQEDQGSLFRLLVQYPSITHAAYQTLEPSIISAYLFSISE
jgi:arginyl-tRNA synthetase